MKRIVVFVFLGLVFGCQDVKRPEKPENLLTEDKMVEVLADAYVSEAARSTGRIEMINNNLSLDSLFYASHGIDSLQFVNSNAYYTTQIDTYLNILEKVEDELNVKKKVIDSLRGKDADEKDVQEESDSTNQKATLLKPASSQAQDSLQ